MRDTIQAVLDDPEAATRQFVGPGGRITVEEAVDQFVTSDVLVHTWESGPGHGPRRGPGRRGGAPAGRGDGAVREALRASGHYGPRVVVPDGVDDQIKLLAFMGRRP